MQLLVVCLTFEILFTKLLDFFHMWVFGRISTNFAHLATCSFESLEFMDWPVLKRLGILVCQTSVTVVRKEQEHNLISSLVSMISAKSA